MLGRLRSYAVRIARRLWRIIWAAGNEYGRDYCPQMASAISYGVLFSLFPLAIFLVSILGLVMQNDARREEVTTWLIDNLPLSDEAGLDLAKAVSGIASPFSIAGLVALVGLLWSASGMMAAIRAALSNIWRREPKRSVVRGKLFDFLLVLVAGLLLLASFGVTLAVRVVQQASADTSDSLGSFGSVVFAAGELTEIVLPVALTCLTFVLLYRYVPTARPPWREVWPAALGAAVAVELLKTGYAYYLAYFADYNVIYGSLGAVIGFLFLVYLAATVFLFAAEVASVWPETRDGPVDSKEDVRQVHVDP